VIVRLLRGFAALAAVGFLLIVAFAIGAQYVLSDRSLPTVDTNVIVPDGATARDVGRLLESQGIIHSALVFDALVRLHRDSAKVKAGEFLFPKHATVDEVLHQVTGAGRQVATWITVPEGFTAKEIARTLADHGIGTYDRFADDFLSTPLEVAGTKAPTLEGYLFPDTYLVPQNASPGDVAKIMTTKFFSELPPDAPQLAKTLGYTVPQIVTIASLVEREAKADDERALMAGVYYNRLKRGMPLQVDATIEYTFAHHKDVITFADLATDSPYNTYKHMGLPPTPIANPGRPSLMAAFYPRRSAYYYYVYAGNGHSAFARTLAEHEANVARYVH
jgi:UPF0755 protein